MKKIFLAVATVLVIVSCSKNYVETPIQIQATSVIEGSNSKAVLTPSAVLSDLVFLRLDDASATQSVFDFSNAVAITSSSRASDGTITFGQEQTYDKSEKYTYMRGFTTDKATVNALTSTVWAIDGATDVLLTDVWNAGVYTTPIRIGMEFKHQLSRIEVICQGEAGVDAAVLQDIWGDITNIKLVGSLPELTYTYSNNTVSGSGAATDFTLLKGTQYDAAQAFAATAVQVSGGTVVCGSAMVCPQTSVVKLKITTAKKTEREITTTLAKLERAKIHKITLTFGSDGKTITSTDSIIEDWGDGTPGSGSVSAN